eukprot:60921-Pleurochrysis_carterae.AAC.5
MPIAAAMRASTKASSNASLPALTLKYARSRSAKMSCNDLGSWRFRCHCMSFRRSFDRISSLARTGMHCSLK